MRTVAKSKSKHDQTALKFEPANTDSVVAALIHFAMGQINSDMSLFPASILSTVCRKLEEKFSVKGEVVRKYKNDLQYIGNGYFEIITVENIVSLANLTKCILIDC